jgi:hypothetical protein
MSLEAFEIFFVGWLIFGSAVVVWFLYDERKDRKAHYKNERRKLREINNRIVEATAILKDSVWDACNIGANHIVKEIKKNGKK